MSKIATGFNAGGSSVVIYIGFMLMATLKRTVSAEEILRFQIKFGFHSATEDMGVGVGEGDGLCTMKYRNVLALNQLFSDG